MDSFKSYIRIKVQFEGYHKWADAPSEVYFLRDLHRHIFKVSMKIDVNHDDRDLEFIMVKREMQIEADSCLKYLGEKASCEMIAKFLINRFLEKHKANSIVCEVSEDGENSGIVEYQKLTAEEEGEKRWNRSIGGNILTEQADKL